MKKLILIFVALSFFSVCFAGSIQDMHKAEIARKNATVVTCDVCSGTLIWSWHMEDDDATPDITIGNPCGCSDDENTTGTKSGSPVFSTTQKSDGSLSLFVDTLNYDYTFGIGSISVVDIKITFDIYIVSYPASGQYMSFLAFREATPNDDFLYLQIHETGGVIQANYSGWNAQESIQVAVATGSWVSCEYQFKDGVAGNDNYIICGETSTEEDDDPSALHEAITTLEVGSAVGTGTGSYYLDNVKISACDKY